MEIRSVQPFRGELVFYVEDYVPGKNWIEVPITPGQEMMIRKLPVVIRACIMDANKKRLKAGTANAKMVDIVQSGDQAFQYSSAVGETLWTIRGENYKWEPDAKDRWTTQHLRRADARDSSPYAKGDVLEIFPTQGTAQNLVFFVEASSQGWHRQSIINKKSVIQDLEPQNGVASARVVISIFPK
jgi:hypothetical protein